MAKNRLQLKQQLASIPIHNARIRETPDTDGTLVVEVDLTYKGLLRFMYRGLKLRTTRRYRLDGLGLEVYRMIDGIKSFEVLIDEFANKNRLTFFEGRAFLMQYLQMLMQKGLVAIGIPNSQLLRPSPLREPS
ncbi:MAG: hypothetical protein WCL49_09780 [bacterium]